MTLTKAALTKRRRSQTVIFSSDDEDGSRNQISHNSVWLAIYEELPNISENEKRVLKLQTMNSFVIGVFTDYDSAQVACIRYVKSELDRPDEDFEQVDWEEDGWLNDDLIDELDPFQRVYIMKHFVHYFSNDGALIVHTIAFKSFLLISAF